MKTLQTRGLTEWDRTARTSLALAMQKVMGSIPIIRFSNCPQKAGYCCL
jgi:hypothetical protein